MSGETQLLALLKARELDEQRALQRHSEIETVLADRRKQYEALEQELARLNRERAEYEYGARLRAVQRSNPSELRSVTEYARRLSQRADGVTKELDEARTHVQRALERSQAAEQDVVNARIERRRVERLLDERSRQELIQGSALEESLLDEMASGRHRRETREE